MVFATRHGQLARAQPGPARRQHRGGRERSAPRRVAVAAAVTPPASSVSTSLCLAAPARAAKPRYDTPPTRGGGQLCRDPCKVELRGG